LSYSAARNGSSNVIRLGADDGVFQNVKQPHFRNLYQKIGLTGHECGQPGGFGFMHDGQEASIVSFLSRTLFAAIPANVKTNFSAFLQCWDNGTAPAVGYNRTVVATNVTGISLSNDWSVLEDQAFFTNVDLVIKGTLDGVQHGMLYQPSSPSSGYYKLDSTNMAPLTRAQLTLKVQAGDTLTLLARRLAPETEWAWTAMRMGCSMPMSPLRSCRSSVLERAR